MNLSALSAELSSRCLHISLSVLMVMAPSFQVLAQGYGAQQAVRQRVQGLGSQEFPGETYDPGSRNSEPATGEMGLPVDGSTGMIDTLYVAPTASILLVVRPAQIMASPIAEILPTEVFSAVGTQYIGADPAQFDEVVAFADLSNPLGPEYGLTIKFNQPFRASSIPPERHAHAQLAELGGKKYLKSAHPLLYSLYGPNQHTLVLATDPVLGKLVESHGQPKSGPLVDRARAVPAGHDLYLAIDLVSLRPLIQMGISQVPAQMPDTAKPLLELPNLIAAVELTFNVSNPGPTSLIIHATDDAAAQQLEMMLLALSNPNQASPEAAPAVSGPISQALARYRERILQPFRPQRSGTSITCFHLDGQNPTQRQLVSSTVVALSLMIPAFEAAASAQMNQLNQAQAPEAADVSEPPQGEFAH